MWHKSFPHSLKRYIKPGIASRSAAVVVLGWGAAVGGLLAQDTAPAPQPAGGLLVRTVSAYAGYDSKTLPNGGGFQPGAATLPADVSLGGSAVFEWTKFSERSSFLLRYTPSYTGRVRYSSSNAFNHALSLNTTRKIAPRWTLGFSLGGDLSSLEQFLFAPTTFSNAASVPSTFDDLAAGILASKFTNNPQLGTVLNSAPLVDSPVRSLLYGQRMFSSSAQSSLSYSYSPRLSFTFSGGGGRTQRVSDDRTSANSSLIPNTTSGNAGMAISYSLSPLTQLGATVNTTRISSALQDAYTTTSLAALGHTFNRLWFMQLHGGVGISNPVRQTSFVIPTKPRPAAGGSLGLKTFSHTLLGSFDRTVSDSYGVGASTSTSANGSWRWGQPGRAWWLESSAGWQKLQGNALTNTSGWHASTGFGRAFTRHLTMLMQYAYLSYSGQSQRAGNSLSQSAVRVSLVWSPQSATAQ